MVDKYLLRKSTRILKRFDIKHLKVLVKDGIISVEGSVESYDLFVAIGQRLGSIKHVEGVVNNLVYPEKIPSIVPLADSKDMGQYDVVIIGGGISGCAIARELSRYAVKVAVVEKEGDVGCGATKANNGMIHSGIGENMHTLKQKLCVQGHKMFPQLAEELGIPYKKDGMYIIFTKNSLQYPLPSFLKKILCRFVLPRIVLSRGKKLGISQYLVKRKELFEKEPNIRSDVLCAVFSPTYTSTAPYLFAIALAENAIQNGVDIFLDTEVVDIKIHEKAFSTVHTTKGTFHARFVINAAGVFADKIAEMAGAKEYTIYGKKGATVLFDKEVKEYVKHSISHVELPKEAHYKGGGVLKTVEGIIQWGPTIKSYYDKENTAVTQEDLHELFRRFSTVTPTFPTDKVITYFTGVRACTFTEDFIIRPAKRVKGFIHVAGIQSPGLTAAPAIAQKVVSILESEGLALKVKEDFHPTRLPPVVFQEASDDEKQELVRKNPKFGHVVCRCEQVTEAEIIQAIHSPIPAVTIDAVKRRTRAGMGRCQGGFCLIEVAKIIARETGIPLELVQKNTKESSLFVGKTKETLGGGTSD